MTGRLVRLTVYMAIGALVMAKIEPHFEENSRWPYIKLLFWPLYLLIHLARKL